MCVCAYVCVCLSRVLQCTRTQDSTPPLLPARKQVYFVSHLFIISGDCVVSHNQWGRSQVNWLIKSCISFVSQLYVNVNNINWTKYHQKLRLLEMRIILYSFAFWIEYSIYTPGQQSLLLVERNSFMENPIGSFTTLKKISTGEEKRLAYIISETSWCSSLVTGNYTVPFSHKISEVLSTLAWAGQCQILTLVLQHIAVEISFSRLLETLQYVNLFLLFYLLTHLCFLKWIRLWCICDSGVFYSKVLLLWQVAFLLLWYSYYCVCVSCLLFHSFCFILSFLAIILLPASSSSLFTPFLHFYQIHSQHLSLPHNHLVYMHTIGKKIHYHFAVLFLTLSFRCILLKYELWTSRHHF